MYATHKRTYVDRCLVWLPELNTADMEYGEQGRDFTVAHRGEVVVLERVRKGLWLCEAAQHEA